MNSTRLAMVTVLLFLGCGCAARGTGEHRFVTEFEGAVADAFHDDRAEIVRRAVPFEMIGRLEDGSRVVAFVLDRSWDEVLNVSHTWTRTSVVLAGDLAPGPGQAVAPEGAQVRAWLVSNLDASRLQPHLLASQSAWREGLIECWRAIADDRWQPRSDAERVVPLHGQVRVLSLGYPRYTVVVNLASDSEPSPDSLTLVSGVFRGRDQTDAERLFETAVNVTHVISVVVGFIAAAAPFSPP
jgi:hypothetical protein